jgi:hypothetical protein
LQTVRFAVTYAYAASQQRHYTVEELLAAPVQTQPLPGSESGSITQGGLPPCSTTSLIWRRLEASFDAVLPDLKRFTSPTANGRTGRALPESQQALKDLHGAPTKGRSRNSITGAATPTRSHA